MAAAVCLLAIVNGVGSSKAEKRSDTTAGSAGPDCTALLRGRPLTYRNRRWGFGLSYPSTFVFDPDSVPASGDSARFWTADRRATAVVTSLPNNLGLSLSDLLSEAKQEILVVSHGAITFAHNKDNWFVLSGIIARRIFYRRTFLSQTKQMIATLWIEFPRNMLPCFEEAVTTMSLTFRESK